MKILHNEVSRYEPVTGPRGAHFLPPPVAHRLVRFAKSEIERGSLYE